MRDYNNHKVWEKNNQFAPDLNNKTKSFPREEILAPISEIRRAVTSIPFNIAEGCGRRSDAEFACFQNIAACSASVGEEELLLSYDLELMDTTSYLQYYKEDNDIKAVHNKLIETLHESFAVKAFSMQQSS